MKVCKMNSASLLEKLAPKCENVNKCGTVDPKESIINLLNEISRMKDREHAYKLIMNILTSFNGTIFTYDCDDLQGEDLTLTKELVSRLKNYLDTVDADKLTAVCDKAPENFTKIISVPVSKKAEPVEFDFGEKDDFDSSEKDEFDFNEIADGENCDEEECKDDYEAFVKDLYNSIWEDVKEEEQECLETAKNMGINLFALSKFLNTKYPSKKNKNRAIIKEIKTLLLEKCITFLQNGQSITVDDCTLHMIEKYLYATMSNYVLYVNNNKVTLRYC